MVTITSTDSSINGISSKANFHIMKDLTQDTTSVVSTGNFTSYELNKIGRNGDTFHTVRSSITISNISAYRIAASTESGVFIYLLYLQDRTMTLRNFESHVTGTISFTQDPVNVVMENIYVDYWKVRAGFMFFPNCNYPEAFITPNIYVSNYTAFVSSTDDASFMPNGFYYSGPGNITVLDLNMTDFYGLSSLALSTFLVSVETNCIPDDGLTKTYELHTVYLSLTDNPFGTKTNMYAINLIGDSSRVNVVNASNININDVVKTSFPIFIIMARQTDTFYISDSYNQNYQTYFALYLLSAKACFMTNITFKDVASLPTATIQLMWINEVTITEIKFINYTGSNSPVSPVFRFTDTPQEFAIFTDISFSDSNLMSQNFMLFSSITPIKNLQFEGLHFSNIKIGANSAVISISTLQRLKINNFTLNQVSSTDSIDIESVAIKASSIDMNSTENIEISNVDFQNSSISLLSFPSFVNSPPTTKRLTFTDMAFYS